MGKCFFLACPTPLCFTLVAEAAVNWIADPDFVHASQLMAKVTSEEFEDEIRNACFMIVQASSNGNTDSFEYFP